MLHVGPNMLNSYMVHILQAHWGQINELATWLRSWQYNDQISEYYVITEDKRFLRASDTTKHQEETELGDS